MWDSNILFGEYVEPGVRYVAQFSYETNQWLERPLGDELPEQVKGFEMYFSPLSFSGERKPENVVEPVRLLWSDYDDSTWRRELEPNFFWQTSVGHWQVVYVLDRPVDLEVFTYYNSTLTWRTGADNAVWPPHRLLRVPGTYNFRRDCRVGRLRTGREEPYSLAELDAFLKEYDVDITWEANAERI